jgi:hypothetical protein
MMRCLLAAVGLGAFAACAASAQRSGEPHDWRIVPGVRVGPVTADISEADLVRLLGRDQVESREIHVGEDFFEPGAVLYPSDPRRKLEVVWGDTTRRALPTRVTIRGDSSSWYVDGGITLGTNLRELERINGAEFVLMGFEWDYSGTVASWEGGALERLAHPAGQLVLALNPPATGFPSDVYYAVSGDREFASSHPAMRQLNPTVHRIVFLFPRSGR